MAANRGRRTRMNPRFQEEDMNDEETPRKARSKWAFPFCFRFTNQAGSVIFSFSGFALMMTTMLTHWYAPSLTSSGVRSLQNLLIHTYLFVMLAGFIITFIAAYMEKGVLAKVAALFILVGTVLYIIFFILSFFTSSMAMLYVCPEMRCPDHHWLQDSIWRGYVVYSENIQRYRNIERDLKQIEDKLQKDLHKELLSNEFNNSYRYSILQDPFSNIYSENKRDKNNSLKFVLENLTAEGIINIPEGKKGQYIRIMKEPVHERSTFRMIISIIFGLIIIAYLVYAIITIFAYGMYLTRD